MDHDEIADDYGAMVGLSEEDLEALRQRDDAFRKARLKQDIAEAQRRLEVAIQLLADATAFLDDEDES